MKCRNKGRVPNLFFGLRAAHPTEVPKAFEVYTSLLHDLKKAFISVAPLESKPFEAPVVVAVATPSLSFFSLRVSIYMTSGRYKVHLFRRGR
jgi:hypothetical protein